VSTLEQHIRSLDAAGFSIWVAGHSLGGALATMTAMQFRDSIAGICTLGSPRVGDPEFVRAFDGHFGPRSARYVNDHDLVARVPPELIGVFGIGLHYGHVGQLRFIDGNGVISGGAAEPSFFSDVFGNPLLVRTMFATFRLAVEGQRLPAGAVDLLVPESLLDHMPKAYACTIGRQVA
jgi:pimeloyl-ACP methyl ester carboxylesterase